jgi:hypothetical protein
MSDLYTFPVGYLPVNPAVTPGIDNKSAGSVTGNIGKLCQPFGTDLFKKHKTSRESM